jgi:hypothetical protein
MAVQAPELPNPLREALEEVVWPTKRPNDPKAHVSESEIGFDLTIHRENDRRVVFIVGSEEEEMQLRKIFGQTTEQVGDTDETVLGFNRDWAPPGTGEVRLNLGRPEIMTQVL